MNQAPTRVTGVPRLVTIAVLGGIVGLFVAGCWNPLPLAARSRVVPAAYRIPKIPGGTPLRLAMVHDILHERYLRHGPTWYNQRNVDARRIIARETAVSPPSSQYLDALDDLAIGLESTGQYDEALATMRKKLLLVAPLPTPTSRPSASQDDQYLPDRGVDRLDLQRILAAQKLSLIQHHQYTACANLGTILVHSAMPKALAGDGQAKSRVREGLDFIEQSISINPGAHFGRETWQAIAIEHLLAATDQPELLLEYDLIGEPFSGNASYRTPYRDYFDVRLPLTDFESKLTPDRRLEIRSRIIRAGIDRDWAKAVRSDYTMLMPFDEPTLAIIGMWTLGGGPSPHFALALGLLMDDVGQREIAWNAYERAVELEDRFWPDPAIRAKMVSVCRDKQIALARIEATDTDAWQIEMRRRHTSELIWGLAYQKAYQDFEAAQIAAGVSLNSPDFYTPFFKDRPSIASAPGLVDDFIVTQQEADSVTDFVPCIALGTGIAMAIGLMLPEGRRGWRKKLHAGFVWAQSHSDS